MIYIYIYIYILLSFQSWNSNGHETWIPLNSGQTMTQYSAIHTNKTLFKVITMWSFTMLQVCKYMSYVAGILYYNGRKVKL